MKCDHKRRTLFESTKPRERTKWAVLLNKMGYFVEQNGPFCSDRRYV